MECVKKIDPKIDKNPLKMVQNLTINPLKIDFKNP